MNQEIVPPPIQACDRVVASQTTSDRSTAGLPFGPNPLLDWLGWWTYLMIVAGPGFVGTGGVGRFPAGERPRSEPSAKPRELPRAAQPSPSGHPGAISGG